MHLSYQPAARLSRRADRLPAADSQERFFSNTPIAETDTSVAALAKCLQPVARLPG